MLNTNNKKRGAVARRRVSTEWRLHWGIGLNQLLVCVFFIFFNCYLFFEHLFYLRYLFYAIFIVNHFNCFIFAHALQFIYLCIHTLHSEPIKALDPSSSFFRLEKKDSGGKCDLYPLMLIWTFAWIVTHPTQRVLWNFLPILML